MIKILFGTLLIFWGILDGLKYYIQGQKIRSHKSAKGQSRKFINIAVGSDMSRLIYGIFIGDIFIISTSIVALVCMLFMWEQIRRWYPYKMRGCANFKRPNIFLYTINSILPNRIRRRL